MTQANQTEATKDTSKEPAKLTLEQAAKLVKREVLAPPEKEGGESKVKHVAVAADEVLDFKEYETHVVVVTKDGQKFTGEK